MTFRVSLYSPFAFILAVLFRSVDGSFFRAIKFMMYMPVRMYVSKKNQPFIFNLIVSGRCYSAPLDLNLSSINLILAPFPYPLFLGLFFIDSTELTFS